MEEALDYTQYRLDCVLVTKMDFTKCSLIECVSDC